MSATAKKKKKKLASAKSEKKRKIKTVVDETQDEIDAAAWESGKLGRDEKFVARADPKTERLIDESLNLKPISIRLPPQAIEQLKALAAEEGLGYQPYVRMVLMQHIRKRKKEAI